MDLSKVETELKDLNSKINVFSHELNKIKSANHLPNRDAIEQLNSQYDLAQEKIDNLLKTIEDKSSEMNKMGEDLKLKQQELDAKIKNELNKKEFSYEKKQTVKNVEKDYSNKKPSLLLTTFLFIIFAGIIFYLLYYLVPSYIYDQITNFISYNIPSFNVTDIYYIIADAVIAVVISFLLARNIFTIIKIIGALFIATLVISCILIIIGVIMIQINYGGI